MKKRNLNLFFLVILTVLAFTTCFSDFAGSGETATVTINLGGARAAAWPPSNANGILSELELHININGERDIILPKGELSAKFSVSSGPCNITVKAIYDGDILYASGTGSVDVKAGQSSDVTVTMREETVIYNIASEDDFFAVIEDIAKGTRDKEYIINVTGNFDADLFDTEGLIGDYDPEKNNNYKITLRSRGSTPYTIDLSRLMLERGTTLTIKNITLRGKSDDRSLVFVNGGTLVMEKGATITGNIYYPSGGTSYGGGVLIREGSIFIMNDGTISDNHATSGAGVYVEGGGRFEMKGGVIRNNGFYALSPPPGSPPICDEGGGVYIEAGGHFIMSGGNIINNISNSSGAGVKVDGTFTIDSPANENNITGNDSSGSSGYVQVNKGGAIGATINGNAGITDGW